MFCNYENITDYCLNNFSYQYASLKNDGFFLSDDTSDSASVYRTDLTNGTTKLISLLSSDIVLGCDSNDDESNISEWNCYQIYRNLGESNISSAPLETYIEYQKKLVAESYSNVLDSGISISLRENNFILSAKIEDVIYYASLSSQAQYLYDNDPDNQMPSFFDKDGNTHTLSYSDLIFVLKIYLNKVIHYKNLIDNINRLIDNVETIDEINDLGWCDDKIISSLVEDTKIEDKEANPPIISQFPSDIPEVINLSICGSVSTCLWVGNAEPTDPPSFNWSLVNSCSVGCCCDDPDGFASYIGQTTETECLDQQQSFIPYANFQCSCIQNSDCPPGLQCGGNGICF